MQYCEPGAETEASQKKKMTLEMGVGAVTLAQELLNFIPDLGRKMVNWRDILNENPYQMDSILLDLSFVQETLSSLDALFSEPGSSAKNRLLHLRFKHLREKTERVQNRCAEISKQSMRKRVKVYPSVFNSSVNKMKEELAAMQATLTDLETSMDVSPRVSVSHSSNFCVVRNVGKPPPGVLLDFDSVDANGIPSTYEGKLKAALFEAGDCDISGMAIGTVAAKGMGGVGKTCAILGIGLLAETNRRFSGGTLFMTIGAEDGLSRLIDALAETVALAGGHEGAEEIRVERSLPVAIRVTGEWFREHACLFIIDDIWCVRGITPHIINELCNIARHRLSRVAYTTRDERLVCGKHVFFQARPKDGNEAKQILLRCAGGISAPSSGPARDAFTGVLNVCDGLPLSLAIAGSAVGSLLGRRNVENEEHVWQEYLDRRGPDEMLENISNVSDKCMERSVLLSLDLIDEARGTKHAQHIFGGFCVLRKQQAAPISVVARLWGLEVAEAEKVAYAMERFAVVQLSTVHVDRSRKVLISLHDLILNVARRMWKQNEESGALYWGRRLINTYISEISLEPNSSFIPSQTLLSNPVLKKAFQRTIFGDELMFISDDGFILGNLCRLLSISKTWNDLIWLVFNPTWIAKQMRVNGDAQVAQDLQCAIDCINGEFWISEEERKQNILVCIYGMKQAIRLSTSAVRNSAWAGMLSFQLYGRMAWMAKANDFVMAFVSALREKKHPWLHPSFGFLDAAGTSLHHEICYTDSLLCVTEAENDVILLLKSDSKLFVKSYNLMDRTEHTSELRFWGSIAGPETFIKSATVFAGGEGILIGLQNGDVWLCDRTGESLSEMIAHVGVSNGVDAMGVNVIADPDVAKKKGRNLFSRFRWYERKHRHARVENPKVKKKDDEQRSELLVDGWRLQLLSGHSTSILCLAVAEPQVDVAKESYGDDPWNRMTPAGIDRLRIVSCSGDHSARVWHKRDGIWKSEELRSQDTAVVAVATTRNGKRIVCGFGDGILCVWDEDEKGWNDEKLCGHSGGVNALDISNDGKRIVSMCWNEHILVWNEEGSKWVKTILCFEASLFSHLAVSRDGNHLVFGSSMGSVQVFTKGEGEWDTQVLGGHTGAVSILVSAGDGKRILSGSYDGTVRVWDRGEGRWENLGIGNGMSRFSVIDVCNAGKRVVCGSHDGTLRIYDRTEGGEWEYVDIGENCGGMFWIAVARAGTRVISKSIKGPPVCVWDERDGEWEIVGLECGMIGAVGVTNDGGRVVVGSTSGAIQIWDEVKDREWKCVEYCVQLKGIRSIGTTENEGRFASWSWDGTIRVWNEGKDGWQSTEVCTDVYDEKCQKLTMTGKRIVLSCGDGTTRHVWSEGESGWEVEKVGSEIGDKDATVADLPEVFGAEQYDWMQRVVSDEGLRKGLVDVLSLVQGIRFKLLTSTGYCLVVERVPYIVFVDVRD